MQEDTNETKTVLLTYFTYCNMGTIYTKAARYIHR